MHTTHTRGSLIRGTITLVVTVVLAAVLPIAVTRPSAAATTPSQGCEWINDGSEYHETGTTGIGSWNNFYAGDSITLVITRNAATRGLPTWIFEVDNKRIARTTLTASTISFTYTFPDDQYSNVFLYTTGTSGADMTASCVPTSTERLRITTWPFLQGGPELEPYSASLGASGGSAPYAWSVASGTLPPGLTMSSAGLISGTPSEPGVFEFVVSVADANGASVTRGVQIDIWPVETDEAWSAICHLTDTGYQFDVVPAAALEGDGEHAQHDGDIVPPSAVSGERNWGAAGEQVFMDGCISPLDDLIDVDDDGLIALVDPDDDGDGLPDVTDSDDDGDGVPDTMEASQLDTDNDGLPDVVDSDDDGDGIADVADPDRDGNGVRDLSEGHAVVTPDQDADGVPDAIDGDDDGDCIPDTRDADRDGDGIADVSDPDLDNDGIPNAQDPDMDGDGAVNLLDPDPDGNAVGGSPSTRALLRTSCASADDLDGDQIPNVEDPDDDGDGIPDSMDRIVSRPWVDTDADGIPNVKDPDIDNDGVPNAQDPDMDGDGVIDTRDKDTNADGIVETRDNPLTEPFTLPAISAGDPVTLAEGPLLTKSGRNAVIDVTCSSAPTTRAKPAGDVGVPHGKGRCLVFKAGDRLRLFVYEGKPTLVTVRITTPAVDNFRLAKEVVTTTVQ